MIEIREDMIKINANMFELHKRYLAHFQKIDQRWTETFLVELPGMQKEIGSSTIATTSTTAAKKG